MPDQTATQSSSQRTRLSRDQERAAAALKLVQDALKDKSRWDKFRTQVNRFPARIQATGLLQASVFVLSKKEAPALLKGLSQWVIGAVGIPKPTDGPDREDALLRVLVESGATVLRRATDEAVAFLIWVKRFADAYAPPDQKHQEQ